MYYVREIINCEDAGVFTNHKYIVKLSIVDFEFLDQDKKQASYNYADVDEDENKEWELALACYDYGLGECTDIFEGNNYNQLFKQVANAIN